MHKKDVGMGSKVKDFLKDEDFIDYALGVSQELVSQWGAYFRMHPDERADAEEAKSVLLAPVDVDCDFSIDECNELRDRIVGSIDSFQVTLYMR